MKEWRREENVPSGRVETRAMGKCFLKKAENVCKAKVFFKDIKRIGLWWGRENGEKARKIYERKKKNSKIWNEVWSGFNLHQLANKSMKAVLGMDIPSVM